MVTRYMPCDNAKNFVARSQTASKLVDSGLERYIITWSKVAGVFFTTLYNNLWYWLPTN